VERDGKSLNVQAQRAMGVVVEGVCQLCCMALRVHDGPAWCGNTYTAATNSLQIRPRALHYRNCEHWDAIWSDGRTLAD
jgi:hypothetical protein